MGVVRCLRILEEQLPGIAWLLSSPASVSVDTREAPCHIGVGIV